jgi:preprotein translocase SecE subunit
MADKKKQASQGSMRSQSTQLAKAQSGGKEQSTKSVKATTSDERKERAKGEIKLARRETKGSSPLMNWLRNNRVGRFALESYYELRHKVTWPTFEEARNMTFVVIGLSAAVAAVLGLADYGLTQLFLLISGK